MGDSAMRELWTNDWHYHSKGFMIVVEDFGDTTPEDILRDGIKINNIEREVLDAKWALSCEHDTGGGLKPYGITVLVKR